LKRTLAVAVALLVFVGSSCWSAETFEKVGTVGAQFLKIGVGARAIAMGEAFVAVSDDATSIYWNPAGIAGIEGSEFNLSHASWPAELSHNFATYVFSYRFLPGVIGLGATFLSMDPMPERTEYRQQGTGYSFDAGSMAFGLTYGNMFTDRFSFGVTLKWIHEGLADYSAEAFAVDLGTLYDTGFRDIRIGMCFQNMGSGYTFRSDGKESPMPIMFKVGASMPFLDIPDHRFLGSFEFNHPPDGAERINVGGEYVYQKFGPNFEVALRGGYRFNRDEEGLAGGFGVKFPFVRIGLTNKPSLWRVDYGFSDMGLLGTSHKISLSANF